MEQTEKTVYVNPRLSEKANKKVNDFMALASLQGVIMTKKEAVVRLLELVEIPKKIS